MVINADKIINMTGHIKKISKTEKAYLEKKITLDELNKCINSSVRKECSIEKVN